MAVDYQILTGELITENSKLKNQLSHALQELESVYHMADTEPNNMKLGKMIRQYYWDNTEEVEEPVLDDEPVYVYESPDNGKTLYRREIGAAARERMNTSEQMSLFGEGDTEL